MAEKWKPPLVEPGPARLIASVFFDAPEFFLAAKKKMEAKFGDVDYESPMFATELLMPLYSNQARNKMKMLSFRRPIGREELVDIRKKTLSIETDLQQLGAPLVEIDPGYVCEFTVVRTALRDHFHYVYLYGGIFAETLYYFESGSFRPFITTPEFYRSGDVISAFNDVRLAYVSEM